MQKMTWRRLLKQHTKPLQSNIDFKWQEQRKISYSEAERHFDDSMSSLSSSKYMIESTMYIGKSREV